MTPGISSKRILNLTSLELWGRWTVQVGNHTVGLYPNSAVLSEGPEVQSIVCRSGAMIDYGYGT